MHTASDKTRFSCVWQGHTSIYKLGSLSDHIRAKLDPTGPNYIVYDHTMRPFIVPKIEIRVCYT